MLNYNVHVLQGSSVVCEVWRMLHSVAGQLEYTVHLGRSLQDAIRYSLELFANAARPDINREQQQKWMQFIVSIQYYMQFKYKWYTSGRVLNEEICKQKSEDIFLHLFTVLRQE